MFPMPYLKLADTYYACIRDLIGSPEVLSMDRIPHHTEGVSCLFHCLFVSYVSFRLCRFFHLDWSAAARGGLLHDLFLYDWRKKGSHSGLHGFSHPKAALQNAGRLFDLSDKEKDIIVKHMWPLTLRQVPGCKESMVVSTADKLCAAAECFHLYKALHMDVKLVLAARLFFPRQAAPQA